MSSSRKLRVCPFPESVLLSRPEQDYSQNFGAMILLLEIGERMASYHLLPLQFGEVDTFFLLLVGIGFAIVVIAVIIFALRRTSAISDEFSKEAKAKFDAIKPAGTIRTEEPPTPKPRVSTLSLEGRAPETGLSTVRSELQDTRTRLQQYVRDVLRDREATRSEIEAIRTEIRTLREKLLTSTLEIQKLRGSLEQQNLQL